MLQQVTLAGAQSQDANFAGAQSQDANVNGAQRQAASLEWRSLMACTSTNKTLAMTDRGQPGS